LKLFCNLFLRVIRVRKIAENIRLFIPQADPPQAEKFSVISRVSREKIKNLEKEKS